MERRIPAEALPPSPEAQAALARRLGYGERAPAAVPARTTGGSRGGRGSAMERVFYRGAVTDRAAADASAPPLPQYGDRLAGRGDAVDPGGARRAAGSTDAFGLGELSAACLFLVDGLGWEPLAAASRGAVPERSGRRARSITTGFPATTVASLGSLGTGLPPGRHGWSATRSPCRATTADERPALGAVRRRPGRRPARRAAARGVPAGADRCSSGPRATGCRR